jgi:two-component system, OmpR family, sensor kinase
VSLRLRLAVAGALVLGILGVVGYLLIASVWASQVEQIDRQLAGAVPIVAGSLDGSVPRLPPLDTAAAAGGDPRSGLSDFYIATLSGGRRAVLLAPTAAGGQAPRRPAGAPRSATMIHPVTVGSVSGPRQWRAVLVDAGGGRAVLVAQSLARVDATTTRMRWVVLAAGTFVLTVMVAGGYWVERLGLRPIAQVTQVADAIAGGERSRRVAPTGAAGSEASHLARAFNIMLDEQEATGDRLRQFIADASHELRTPVSAIRGFAELWSNGHLRHGPDLDDAMRRVGQEGRRMAGLVEDLLLLARLDENRPMDRADVDLAELVRDAELDASATHPSRDLRCHPAGGEVVVRGDSDGLRQVIANLLRNALVHTPPGASVSVRAYQRAGTAVLEVADTGPGMTPEESARAFDRFWRSDASRTRVSSGLGLPIVAAIVAAHDGTVTLDTSPDRGTVVRVTLPAPRKPATDAQPRDSLTGQHGHP